MNPIIIQVTEGSVAHELGIQKGDVLSEVNGHPVQDAIDFMYYSSKKDIIDLKIRRANKSYSCKIRRSEKADIGFELKAFITKSCRNKCVFCFVDQLPKGMRKPLYLKDEDYRMSFLYGNYITLTNLSDADRKRITEQKLGPLYVSVHTTNNELRRRMIGNPKAPDILQEIHYFTKHKIRIHAQIVLCPGLNDGEELAKTIKDLHKFYPYVASVAVVPVGLTKHRKSNIRTVEKADAVRAIDDIRQFRKRFKNRNGDVLVHPSDELYIKAESPFPPISEYGDFPQIENGVGMVPQFMHAAKKLKLPKKIEPRKAVTFTGLSFMPYLEDFLLKLSSIEGLSLEAYKIENKFLGPSVTVAGLITGKDILKTIMGRTKADCLLIPDVMLREGRDMFLDNVTLKDMEENLGIKAKIIESTPEGLLKGVTDGCKRED